MQKTAMKKFISLRNATIALLLGLGLTAFVIKDDVQLRNNAYGLAEVQVYDLRLGISETFDDGPYTFIESKKKGIERSIVAGKVEEKEIELEQVKFKPEKHTYKEVEKVAVLSDIHGQMDVFLDIIKNNGVVDTNLNWAFGTGHFVITGDIFDRGHQVTETLWFVYHLEKQAEAAGGKVHYLLGNHEYMVLHDDTRYIHDKYKQASVLFEMRYKDLFSQETIIGRWLRSKATVIKINDNLFTHGGLSKEFADRSLSLNKINKLYRKTIDLEEEALMSDTLLLAFHSRNSPIWYRGYFREELPANEIEGVLKQYGAKRIIVGHTSQTEVLKKHDGLVYAVDTSIKKGEYGELLLIEKDVFTRCKMDGERIVL